MRSIVARRGEPPLLGPARPLHHRRSVHPQRVRQPDPDLHDVSLVRRRPLSPYQLGSAGIPGRRRRCQDAASEEGAVPDQYVLLTDQPWVDGIDPLGFDDVAGRLADLVLSSRESSPLAIGVSAAGAAGRSSLMRRLDAKRAGGGDVETVWFNAWTAEGKSSLEGLTSRCWRRSGRRCCAARCACCRLVSGLRAGGHGRAAPGWGGAAGRWTGSGTPCPADAQDERSCATCSAERRWRTGSWRWHSRVAPAAGVTPRRRPGPLLLLAANVVEGLRGGQS